MAVIRIQPASYPRDSCFFTAFRRGRGTAASLLRLLEPGESAYRTEAATAAMPIFP